MTVVDALDTLTADLDQLANEGNVTNRQQAELWNLALQVRNLAQSVFRHSHIDQLPLTEQ